MQKSLKYTIFKTKWGYFGLVAAGNALCRSCLPLSRPERVKSQLLKNLALLNQESSIKFDKNLFRPLQEQIIAYFEGTYVDFSQTIPIVLNGFSPFCASVLRACRRIRFGQVVTYSALAKKIGQAAAARAVGNVLAKNPLPLLIPCHRVIRSDGQIGGFSAIGGTRVKKRLLELERRCCQPASPEPAQRQAKAKATQ